MFSCVFQLTVQGLCYFLCFLFLKIVLRCLGLFQVVSSLFDFLSSGLVCSCCFELFPIILVLVLVVADCLLLVPSCFSHVLCRF